MEILIFQLFKMQTSKALLALSYTKMLQAEKHHDR